MGSIVATHCMVKGVLLISYQEGEFMEKNVLRLAVLIDADNVPASIIEPLLAEITGIGEVSVKRVYGDFTSSYNNKWKETLNKFAIKPVQQFAYTTGKNSTDIALIIDAMDLLHSGRFIGFCIVSSDSDYTGLAVRIKEEGLQVYGFGQKHTPEAFRNACHKFTSFEVLKTNVSEEVEIVEEKADSNSIKIAAKTSIKDKAAISVKDKASLEETSQANTKEESSAKGNAYSEKIPMLVIKEAIRISCDDSGYASLAQVGEKIRRMKPDFDPRLYGNHIPNLSSLLRSLPELFEVRGSGTRMSVKEKSLIRRFPADS